jgi:ribosomal protein S18 acetylase RimI-like enzyme
MMPLDENLAWRIEGACFSAWPALQEAVVDGWLVRFAKGLTRRANSANPLRAGRNESDAVVSRLEEEYRQQKLPVYFRIPSIIGPAMPNRLAQLGYRAEGESLALYGAVEDVDVRADAGVVVAARPDEEWLSAMARMQGQSAPAHVVYRQIVSSIKVPAAFAVLRQDAMIVSLAFGAIHDGLLCVESVITDQAFRGCGFARRMLGALVAHARLQITGVCLQVQADNAVARHLYNSLGLCELYRYHYRSKPFGGEQP